MVIENFIYTLTGGAITKEMVHAFVVDNQWWIAPLIGNRW